MKDDRLKGRLGSPGSKVEVTGRLKGRLGIARLRLREGWEVDRESADRLTARPSAERGENKKWTGSTLIIIQMG
jgi:hypothetical protein